MFGYIQLYQDELKIKNLKEYKSIYCSVCNELHIKYGIKYSMLLNYECVFLYVFLEGVILLDKNEYEYHCILNPLRRGRIKLNKELLSYVAFINVYLAEGKLKDDYDDNNAILNKMLIGILNTSYAYRQDCKKFSYIVNKVDFYLNKLRELEKCKNTNIDDYSKTMGEVLMNIVEFYLDFNKIKSNQKDKIKEIAYILGQWIYIIDAYDDYEKDNKKKNFNPFLNGNVKNYKQIGIDMMNIMIWRMKVILNSVEIHTREDIIKNVINFGLYKKILEVQKHK